jgi:hypothetical protein
MFVSKHPEWTLLHMGSLTCTACAQDTPKKSEKGKGKAKVVGEPAGAGAAKRAKPE